MKIVFISNFYNHHQSSLSNNFDEITNHNYYFIATDYISEERIKLGYRQDNVPDYVYQYQTNKSYCDEIILNADVVIFGCAPYELIENRLKRKKLTFLYKERLYKTGCSYWQLFKYIFLYWLKYGRYKNCYCLAASAFTPYDYSRSLAFINKCYKWGYFPESRKYESIENLMSKKNNDMPVLLWVGRFIDWKHPEIPVQIAKRLKEDGFKFRFYMIGTGNMVNDIQNMISNYELENYVELLGSMRPEKVREYMEKANIYLFTSDKQEGWGAVLNESMNSGCAVVCDSMIGASRFLLANEKNGLMYRTCDVNELYSKVKWLLNNQFEQRRLGKSAYLTIFDGWNAEVASKRFVDLSQAIIDGDKHPILFKTGPCSKAEIIKG